MLRANKHDRQFWETSWMNYIDKNKFKRWIYKEFWDMYWISITGKLKRKMKSVQHYLINPDDKQARHSLKQFMDEVEIYLQKTECE
jgi:hypothetical protein